MRDVHEGPGSEWCICLAHAAAAATWQHMHPHRFKRYRGRGHAADNLIGQPSFMQAVWLAHPGPGRGPQASPLDTRH